MIVDARSLSAGTVVEAEVCIIGGGAAGITLAREFSASRFRVALLESGGMEYETETQKLYAGHSIGVPFPDLMESRQRAFGGTTNLWGGWCLPYDEIDFQARDGLPYYGWPFSKSHLDIWYRRAHEVCQLGPYDYRAVSWGISPKQIPPPFSGPNFECKILQDNPLRFGQAYAPELRSAPRVMVYLHANAFYLDAGDTDSEVKEVSVKVISGTHFTVRARIFILAAGGLENARLLLASGRASNGLGNARDLVGRFLMVHLCYPIGILVPSNPRMNFDFRARIELSRFGGQRSFVSFIGLTAECMRRLQLPSAQILWVYTFSPMATAVRALRRLIAGEGTVRTPLRDLSEVIRNFHGLTALALRKAIFGEGTPVEALAVRCASAQLPNPESRAFLGSERDRLGMREIVVDWRPMAQDKDKAAGIVRLFGAEVEETDFGRLCSVFADENWPSDFHGDEHHLGTTRMHTDPALGVVDENCQMHSVANLYLAGGSVFPNCSANNSTLTIVALALRLADHVKKRLA